MLMLRANSRQHRASPPIMLMIVLMLMIGLSATIPPIHWPISRAPMPITASISNLSIPDVSRFRTSAEQGRNQAEYHIAQTKGIPTATNPAHGLDVTFTSTGMVIQSSNDSWGLVLTDWGRNDSLIAPATRLVPTQEANHLSYQGDALTSWYINGPGGVQQGWTIAARPDGTGPVILELQQHGTLRGMLEADGHGLRLSSSLRYSDLLAYDAAGSILPVFMTIEDGMLRITVDDRRASYPVTIDPWVQNAKLTASDGADYDELGSEVAVSGDGTTIVAAMGSYHIGARSVYVYTRPSGSWGNATQTAKLTTSSGVSLGSPAVNSDGSIIVAEGDGALYVYIRPSGNWMNAAEFAKLTTSDGALLHNLVVSGDGTTIVAGDYTNVGAVGGTERGAVYVYTSGSQGWRNSTQTAKLTASDGANFDWLGRFVAVSSDGSTIVAAQSNNSGVTGGIIHQAAYVYTRPGGSWINSTQTAKLTASDGGGNGWNVAISSNGSTIVSSGAYNSGGTSSGVYVYNKPGGSWLNSLQTAKLITTDGDSLGSPSVSSDGSTIVVGAPFNTADGVTWRGAVYIYTRPGGSWINSTQTTKLTASDGASNNFLGWEVAVSSDGTTIAAGAFDNAAGGLFRGAIYMFGLSTANQVPVVNAGVDQTITLPNTTVLYATASDDGLPNPPGTLNTSWTQTAGPAPATFLSSYPLQPTVSFPMAGTYTFQLCATDSLLLTCDSVQVVVNSNTSNQAPVVNAGVDQMITLPNTAVLYATASDDGLPNPPRIMYTSWTQTAGPAPATFLSSYPLQLTVSFPVVGAYTFQLCVTDTLLQTCDSIQVVVNSTPENQAPVVSAGADQTIMFPYAAVLYGVASDDGLPNPPGILNSLWTQVSGPATSTFIHSGALQSTVSIPEAGTYIFQLCVTDTLLQTCDSIQVIVNQLPVRDSDGDSIPDSIEENGFDFDRNGIAELDLPAMGADKNHKDIFVYVDWLKENGVSGYDHKPREEALNIIKESFANAPIDNPDGIRGINLHVILGHRIEENSQNKILGSFNTACEYNWNEFDAIKNSSFPKAMQPIFHYVVFGHGLPSSCKSETPSGVSRSSPSSDFIVAVGDWPAYIGSHTPGGFDLNGYINLQAGTFMHELGHNLGLGHGGVILDSNGNAINPDYINYKPNHISVMNYAFQTRGLRKKGAFGVYWGGNFDYSRFESSDFPTLDETNLNELQGLKGSDILKNYSTQYYCNGLIKIVDGLNQAVNWNCDEDKQDTNVISDINADGAKTTLTTVNEWTNLRYNGGAIGSFGIAVDLPNTTSMANSDELTLEEDQQIGPYTSTNHIVFLPSLIIGS